jgi:hypothetical protein
MDQSGTEVLSYIDFSLFGVGRKKWSTRHTGASFEDGSPITPDYSNSLGNRMAAKPSYEELEKEVAQLKLAQEALLASNEEPVNIPVSIRHRKTPKRG